MMRTLIMMRRLVRILTIMRGRPRAITTMMRRARGKIPTTMMKRAPVRILTRVTLTITGPTRIFGWTPSW